MLHSSTIRLGPSLMRTMNGKGAGPSTSTLMRSVERSVGNASKERGCTERGYRTQILQVDPSSIRFSGKGKEPVRSVEAHVDDAEQHEALLKASQALQQAHIVAFPTETVYGLAGNALEPHAVQKIFHAKGRPADNPLIIHISDLAMLRNLVQSSYEPSAAYEALMHTFWPGPLTLLMPADEQRVPSVVRCGLETIGVRMPSHPVARALIAMSNLPLAAPSANVSGKPSPTTAQHVYHDMTTNIEQSVVGRIPFIVDGGPSQVGLESTVVDGVTEPNELRVLRPGGVSVEQIEDVLRNMENSSSHPVRVRVYGRDMEKDAKVESTPTTPGMKYRHYSPEAQVVLLISGGGGASVDRSQNILDKDLSQMLARDARDVIEEQVRLFAGERLGAGPVHIGLMCMDDSRIAKSVLGQAKRLANSPLYATIPWACGEGIECSMHGFSLGSSASLEQAAHRLFDGLRVLDGSGGGDGQKCDLIFVEASARDEGVGLAIMNRLSKAASKTFVVQQ